MIRWVSILGVLAAALFVVGCGQGNFSGRSSAGKDNIFRYPIPELTKLDPALVEDGDSIDVLQQIFEGLTKWGEDNTVQPNLAEKWDISADGKVYTFHLKKGVKFSNGREVKADDFKYSIERCADPALQSSTVLTYLGDIVGVKDRVAHKAKDVSGVKVIDDYTLQITIDAPRPYFLARLTYPTSFAVAKEAAPMGVEITKVEQMVGTGPFIADRYVPTEIFTMKANKSYHDGAPLIDGIERKIVADPLTRLNMFKQGQVDLTRVERSDLAGIQSDPKLKDQLKLFDRPSMYYMGMNCAMAPFNNKKVRQAFAYAVDRNKICSDILAGVNKPALAILPPGMPGYRDNAPAFPFDANKARALLAEAGYPGGKGFPKVVMYHRSGQSDVKMVAEALVTQLRQNLGIDASTSELPWTTYLAKHDKKELPLFHMRWGADYFDPENFLSTLLATYGDQNKVNYSNPQFDQLCKTADTMVGNQAQRIEMYQKAEDMALDDAPFVPIYYEKAAELISPRVKGIRDMALGHLPHTTVKLN